MNIAITGASGRIGGLVARHLSERGLGLILPLRNPAKAPALANCEARPFAYGDFALAAKALAGVELLFMVSAAESPTREQEHLTLVKAAVAAGVRHLVYLSFAGASPHSTFTLARTHAVTEAAIQASALNYTFLRDNFYSELLAQLADENGLIAGPAGSGRVAGVSQRDVAEGAARLIAAIATGDKRHDRQTYNFTGGEALSLAEVAEIMTRVSGRPYRYENQTLAEAYASRRRAYPETPGWQLDAWVSTYTAIGRGELAAISPDLPRLLGRPPRTFAAVVEDIYGH